MKKSLLAIVSVSLIFLQISSCKKPVPTYKPPNLIKTKLFYNTHNTINQIDVNNNEWTVHYDNNSFSSLYGLQFTNNRKQIRFTSTAPASGIWEIEPLYQGTGFNNFRNVFSKNLPSDLTTDPSTGITYVAANYGIHRYDGSNLQALSSINLVNQPFSLVIAKGHLIVAGENQVSITNLSNMTTGLFVNSVGMAGFMCLSSSNDIYIADPSDNSIKKLTENDLDYAIQDLANNTTITSSFGLVTAGNLLDEVSGVSDWNIRGPIGIDIKGNDLYITVDTGTSQPGKIVKVNIISTSQTLLYNNIPGPRDILVY
jgi:hypothetical protein